MDTELSNKVKVVLESTTREVNRVLLTWSKSKRDISFQEERSLFRSYFYKSIKKELGWEVFSRSIKPYVEFEPAIKGVYLVGISMSSYTERLNKYLYAIREAIDSFDFSEVSTTSDNKDTYFSEDIDISPNYNHILNIKF